MTPREPGSAPLDLAFSLVSEAAAPSNVDSDSLGKLTKFVLRTEGNSGQWDITVALVDDAQLQILHRDFMGIDTATDIMTFPRDDSGEMPKGGELVISVDHAQTQASAWGLSPAEEIRFLVVHGLLHLVGWRDDTDEERQRMLARQQVLVERWLQETFPNGN